MIHCLKLSECGITCPPYFSPHTILYEKVTHQKSWTRGPLQEVGPGYMLVPFTETLRITLIIVQMNKYFGNNIVKYRLKKHNIL